jgi:hypothetical protein
VERLDHLGLVLPEPAGDLDPLLAEDGGDGVAIWGRLVREVEEWLPLDRGEDDGQEETQGRAFYLTRLWPPSSSSSKGSPRFEGPPTHLIHGGAPGIDSALAAWARRWTTWPVSEIPAAWDTYDNFAGPLRNSLLVRAADFLVSFGGGSGTANCVRQALEHGTPVVDLSPLAN